MTRRRSGNAPLLLATTTLLGHEGADPGALLLTVATITRLGHHRRLAHASVEGQLAAQRIDCDRFAIPKFATQQHG